MGDQVNTAGAGLSAMDNENQDMTTPAADKDDRPLIGISACLNGQRVRYDGKDKFNTLVAEHLAPYCRLLPFCPEAVAGLGIPRPPVNLVQTATGVRAIGRDAPHTDVTPRLHTIANAFCNAHPGISGFILQSRSPSCGLATTPIYDMRQQQVLDATGSGLFAARLRARFPDLPILNDCDLSAERIHAFLRQVAAYQSHQQTAAQSAGISYA